MDNADRIKDNTTIILVNDVIMRRKAGASDRAVKSNNTCIPVERFAPPALLLPISTFGKVMLTCEFAVSAVISSANRIVTSKTNV